MVHCSLLCHAVATERRAGRRAAGIILALSGIAPPSHAVAERAIIRSFPVEALFGIACRGLGGAVPSKELPWPTETKSRPWMAEALGAVPSNRGCGWTDGAAPSPDKPIVEDKTTIKLCYKVRDCTRCIMLRCLCFFYQRACIHADAVSDSLVFQLTAYTKETSDRGAI